MTTPGSDTPARRPLTVTEWSRDWSRWIVSAHLHEDEGWTLVGVFEDPQDAFQAADRASELLARPRGG